jgi:hypothetical protein
MRLIPAGLMAELRAEAARRIDRPTSRFRAASIVLLWLDALTLTGVDGAAVLLELMLHAPMTAASARHCSNSWFREAIERLRIVHEDSLPRKRLSHGSPSANGQCHDFAGIIEHRGSVDV